MGTVFAGEANARPSVSETLKSVVQLTAPICTPPSGDLELALYISNIKSYHNNHIQAYHPENPFISNSTFKMTRNTTIDTKSNDDSDAVALRGLERSLHIRIRSMVPQYMILAPSLYAIANIKLAQTPSRHSGSKLLYSPQPHHLRPRRHHRLHPLPRPSNMPHEQKTTQRIVHMAESRRVHHLAPFRKMHYNARNLMILP